MSRRQFSPRYLAPNLVTGANIAIGFCSILASSHGRYDFAVYLLVACLFCDMFDGQIARALKATSKFGQQMDSFSDALSFGAAPAFLVYQALLQRLGPSGVAVALVYLMAGVLRLARFNLTTNEHVKDHRTYGLPIPISAGYVMAAVLMREEITPAVAAGLAIVLALLMVSGLRLPQPKRRSIVSWMLFLGIANYLAVVAWPSWRTIGWWNLWNVAILVVAWAEEKRRTQRELGAA